MNRFRYVALMLAILVANVNTARSEEDANHKVSVKCESGPVTKIFGGSNWLVYGCSDGKSAAIVSAPGNPAMPFYFFLYPEGGAYQLRGEGTGSKVTTDAAYKELQSMSENEILALIRQTKTVAKKE